MNLNKHARGMSRAAIYRNGFRAPLWLFTLGTLDKLVWKRFAKYRREIVGPKGVLP